MILKKIYWYLLTLLFSPLYGGIGKKTYIGRPSYIYGSSRLFIGNKVRILYGFRCEIYKKGKVLIGENCSIGHNLHMSACELIKIGKNCTVSSNVFIGSLNHSFSDLSLSTMDQPIICKQTHIGKNCFIGTGAVILPGAFLGKNCIIGANSVIKGHYKDYSVIAGSPARIIDKVKSSK